MGITNTKLKRWLSLGGKVEHNRRPQCIGLFYLLSWIVVTYMFATLVYSLSSISLIFHIDKKPGKRKIKNSNIAILEVHGKRKWEDSLNVLNLFWSELEDNKQWIHFHKSKSSYTCMLCSDMEVTNIINQKNKIEVIPFRK